MFLKLTQAYDAEPIFVNFDRVYHFKNHIEVGSMIYGESNNVYYVLETVEELTDMLRPLIWISSKEAYPQQSECPE